MTTRPVHLPDCSCGGTGVAAWRVTARATGTGRDHGYVVTADCPEGPPITDDQWRAWQAGQIAGGHMTITADGLVNRHRAAGHLARARAALNTTTTDRTEETHP